MIIAGVGPERERLEASAIRGGLGGVVHFIGVVSPIDPLYTLLDLVVIPSRSEGLPNVLLEALRADLRVVSTRVGAVADVLEVDDAGRIVTPEDPVALAAAIADELAAPATSRSAGRLATARRFSLDQRVSAHVRLYEEVLADAS